MWGTNLSERFVAFEDVLLSLVGYFYEGQQELENLVQETNRVGKKPDKEEVDKIVRRLGRAKYRIYFFDKLSNPCWIEPLKQEGFFESPTEPEEGEAYERWPEGWYLKKMAPKAPEKVLNVIVEIERGNPYMRESCLECLLEMPENEAAKGVKVVENMLPRGIEEGEWGWRSGGQQAAKLMVKLAESHPTEAFKIAWVLLDVWVLQDGERIGNITAKFTKHDYSELVLKHFANVWEVEQRIWEGVNLQNAQRASPGALPSKD